MGIRPTERHAFARKLLQGSAKDSDRFIQAFGAVFPLAKSNERIAKIDLHARPYPVLVARKLLQDNTKGTDRLVQLAGAAFMFAEHREGKSEIGSRPTRYSERTTELFLIGPLKCDALLRDSLLQDSTKDTNRLFQPLGARCTLAKSHKGACEVSLDCGPTERFTFARSNLQRGMKGSDCFLKPHNAALALANGGQRNTEVSLVFNPVRWRGQWRHLATVDFNRL